jgi:hypothetical protein
LKSTVFEMVTKRILIRTVTEAITSTVPVPNASTDALRPMPPNEMPNRRASTLAWKLAPKW